MLNTSISDLERCKQREVAAVFGISRPAVAQWKECPRNQDGTYSLPAVVQWRLERLYDAVQVTSDGDSQKSEQLERLRKARADMAELDLREREGNLLEKDHVLHRWGILLARLKTRFLQCPMIIRAKIAETLPTDTAVMAWRIADDEIRAALNEIADKYERGDDDDQ